MMTVLANLAGLVGLSMEKPYSAGMQATSTMPGWHRKRLSAAASDATHVRWMHWLTTVCVWQAGLQT
jgi:hypothetical protein